MAAPPPNNQPPKAAPPGDFMGTPKTYFPAYSMFGAGAWTGLPPPGLASYNQTTGLWGTPPATPATPIPPPATGGGGGGGLEDRRRAGLLSGYGNDFLVSSLSPDALARLTSRWGLLGGGAPLPTTMGDFYTARSAYRAANPNTGERR